MKVFTRILSLALVTIMLAFSLVACAKRVEEGEYVMGDKALTGCYDSIYFEKDTFTYEVYIQHNKQDALCYSGTYELELIEPEDEEQALEDEENGITRGNITMTYTDASGAEQVVTKTIIMNSYEGTVIINDLLYTYFYEEVAE